MSKMLLEVLLWTIVADESTFYQKIKIAQIFVLVINVRENTFQSLLML